MCMYDHNGLRARMQFGRQAESRKQVHNGENAEHSDLGRNKYKQKNDQRFVSQMVHLEAVTGFDNMHVEQIQVPPVADGAFIPAAAQSKGFTLGAAETLLVGADGVERPNSDHVEKLKVGNEEIGTANAVWLSD